MYERQAKNVNGYNVTWLRGSPGVGNSALATSIAARLQNQNQHVISLQSDHNQSAIITAGAFLHTVTCSLACLNPLYTLTCAPDTTLCMRKYRLLHFSLDSKIAIRAVCMHLLRDVK